jgi:hypothetical protein
VTAQEYADRIQEELGEFWLPRVYQDQVLRLRTRPYQFANVNSSAPIQIQHTLLGVELKVGRKRLLCPDLATARYLSIFARLGSTDVALPYNITRISLLADQLESAWYRMLLLVDYHAASESERLRKRVRGLLIARVKAEICRALS